MAARNLSFRLEERLASLAVVNIYRLVTYIRLIRCKLKWSEALYGHDFRCFARTPRDGAWG